ncbi:MAG: DUF3834 domain-containing protein [Nitrospirae bacterium]|nr:MAG: DUF3834 domain-containing protein [Nitrospirota bacterium]
MKLRIGHLSTLYHTSILMQADPSLLEGLDFDIQWSLYGTGPAIVKAFGEGRIDLAYIGLPPATIGIASGLRLKCIAGGHVEGTVISTLKGKRAEDEETLCRAFRGFKRVAVPGRGSIHDLILKDIIHRCGSSVEVLNMAWADEVLEAFVSGKVDAVVGTPSLAEAVRVYADGDILYPPSKLWPYNPSYGIVVREELLEEPEILKEFLKVHERCTEVLREKPEEAAERIASLMGIVDRDFALNTIKISPRYCASLPEEYIHCTERLTRRLYELGYIERVPERDEIFELSIIREVHPQEHHYQKSQDAPTPDRG